MIRIKASVFLISATTALVLATPETADAQWRLALWCEEHQQWCGDHNQRTLKLRLAETRQQLSELGAIQERLRAQREQVDQDLQAEKSTRDTIHRKTD